MREPAASTPGRTLALSCLRGISTERFGRQEEIRSADIELSRLLLHAAK